MLKTTRSSIASAFRVDDDKVVGGGVVLELKVLDVYANKFMRLSKSPASALILFDRKPDESLVSIK